MHSQLCGDERAPDPTRAGAAHTPCLFCELNICQAGEVRGHNWGLTLGCAGDIKQPIMVGDQAVTRRGGMISPELLTGFLAVLTTGLRTKRYFSI